MTNGDTDIGPAQDQAAVKNDGDNRRKTVTFRQTIAALRHRKSAAMYVLGMAAGLPYVLITGTILAWFTDEQVPVKTIGIFSWTSILLGFKFLWSPAIDRAAFPSFFNMGQRRAGILLLQCAILLCLLAISFANPSVQLEFIAVAAVLCTLAFASQDILIDAWRIEVADDVQTVDLLSSVYQIGFRTSAILGGAGALIIAGRFGWQNTFLALVALMGVCVSGVFLAEDSSVQNHRKADLSHAPAPRWRNLGLLPIIFGWTWSLFALFSFMAFALQQPNIANASAFTRAAGPLIIFQSILIPAISAAVLLACHRGNTQWLSTKRPALIASAISIGIIIFWFRGEITAFLHPPIENVRGFVHHTAWIVIISSIIVLITNAIMMLRQNHFATALSQPKDSRMMPGIGQKILDALYYSILVPMVDLMDRLRFGAILVLVLVLSYRFADLVWGAFAYPFYLGTNYGALGHTFDEVAIASKIFGSLMTGFGIVVGGMAILRFGRMPCLVVGAVLAAATNLLYADLALGAPVTHSVLSALHLYKPFAIVFEPLANFLALDATINEKMVQLMMVIAAENLAVGFASAAIVVYLSSIVNPKFAAVQYALLASLSMLIGTLGRGWLGELIEQPGKGFAFVFYLTALLGCVAIVASILEWIRQARNPTAQTSPA